jgi:hypothetical protein
MGLPTTGKPARGAALIAGASQIILVPMKARDRLHLGLSLGCGRQPAL